ncbi:EthD family reductase [Litchfieldella rifensis]|uniref:EthD family reductase n=1 Tax=Litchfieldella rifensis TaxID=762643 RepID=A0ABV7LRB7_9GAMM
MIDIMVMYPNRNEMKFDESYYFNHHAPLVASLLRDYGLMYIQVAKGIERDSPFFLVTHLGFEDEKEFNKAIDDVGSQIFEDIPRFTNVEPLIQLGKLMVNNHMP